MKLMYSRHYKTERELRQDAINKIGYGVVVHISRVWNEKKQRYYLYEITSTAILTVRALDDINFIVTQYPARPSRIKKYWADAPKEIIDISVEHTRMGLVF